MNTPIERLQTALEALGLKAVEARLENLLEQASKKEPSYADFLDELLSCEVEARRTRYLRARLQLAHFPFVKTFEQFDFGFQPSLDERQIRELRSLRFIHEASNVMLVAGARPIEGMRETRGGGEIVAPTAVLRGSSGVKITGKRQSAAAWFGAGSSAY